MRTAEEITNAVQNIEYYTKQIEKLCREQFDWDLENAELITEATNRLDLLGAMADSCFTIQLRCQQLRNYIKAASNIKLLLKPQPEEKVDYTLL